MSGSTTNGTQRDPRFGQGLEVCRLQLGPRGSRRVEIEVWILERSFDVEMVGMNFKFDERFWEKRQVNLKPFIHILEHRQIVL